MPRVHILCLLHHFDSDAQLHWAAAELFIAEQRNVVTNPSWLETLFPSQVWERGWDRGESWTLGACSVKHCGSPWRR